MKVNTVPETLRHLTPDEAKAQSVAVPGIHPEVVPHRYGPSANNVTNPRGEDKEAHNLNPKQLEEAFAAVWDDPEECPPTCRVTGQSVSDLSCPPLTSAQFRKLVYILGHNATLNTALLHRAHLSFAANRHLHDEND